MYSVLKSQLLYLSFDLSNPNSEKKKTSVCVIDKNFKTRLVKFLHAFCSFVFYKSILIFYEFGLNKHLLQ